MTRLVVPIRFLFAVLAAIAGVATASTAKPAETWLPLERVDLFRVLTQGMNLDLAVLATIESCLAGSKVDPASGDDLTFIRNGALPFTITMVGKGDRVHSLILAAPMELFLDEADNVALVGLSRYFQVIYPDWPGAADWPEQSAREVLSKFPYNREARRDSPEGSVPEVTRGGITSVTLGAIFGMDYSVTAREQPFAPVATETNCE